MKRIFALSIVILLTMSCSFTATLMAQDDVMQQAMEGYKQLTTVKANVKKTVHTSDAKDVVTMGTFYFKKPMQMCIATNGGKDKLLADGKSVTFVQDGKASTVNAKNDASLAPLVEAIKGITQGNEDTDLSDVADVDVERKGDLVIMTIAPFAKNAAEKRKMKFTSYVITVDSKVGELRSIQLNEQGQNYQLFSLSNFQKDVKIDDSVFKK